MKLEIKCGNCKHFWPLLGQSILPYWNDNDLAGTCPISTFRLREDPPIMCCFESIVKVDD